MKDMIGREIKVGDFVAYYSNLYVVEALGTSVITKDGTGYVKIMIYPASKTSKPVNKYSKEMVRIPPEDITMYVLKNGGM